MPEPIPNSAFRRITSARSKPVAFDGIHRHVRFTVGCSGVEINERLECLDKDDKPIPGLYAIGNLAGNFYGSVDYPLHIFGLNLGHNYTEGYVVAEELAKL